MKKIIYILLLALVLTGCGKVDKTVKEEIVQGVEVEEKVTEEDVEETDDAIQTGVSSNTDNTTQTEVPSNTAEKVTMYAKSSVNVRSGAGTSNAQIGSLTKGQEVTKVGEENGWSKIEFNGTVGYVSSKYLSTEKVAMNSSNAGNKTDNNTTSNPNNGSSNIETKPSEPVHEHSWEEITEEKKVYYAWRTLCGKCGLDMTDLTDDDAAYHSAIICRSRYSTKYIEVDFVTTDYKIIVTNVGYKCSCGQTKDGTGASWVTDSHITIYTE